MQYKKLYVGVTAFYDEDGVLTPLSIRWSNGKTIKIKRVREVTRAASLKAGGQGTRYTCIIGECEIYLFFEGPAWFVELRTE